MVKGLNHFLGVPIKAKMIARVKARVGTGLLKLRKKDRCIV